MQINVTQRSLKSYGNCSYYGSYFGSIAAILQEAEEFQPAGASGNHLLQACCKPFFSERIGFLLLEGIRRITCAVSGIFYKDVFLAVNAKFGYVSVVFSN